MIDLRNIKGDHRIIPTSWQYDASSQTTYDRTLARDAVHYWSLRDYQCLANNRYINAIKIPVINLNNTIANANIIDYINPNGEGNSYARYLFPPHVQNLPDVNSSMYGRIELGYDENQMLCSVEIKMMKFGNEQIIRDTVNIEIASNNEIPIDYEYITFQTEPSAENKYNVFYFQIIDVQNNIRDVLLLPREIDSNGVIFAIYIMKSNPIDTDISNDHQIYLTDYTEHKFSPDIVLSKIGSSDTNPVYSYDSTGNLLKIYDTVGRIEEVSYPIGLLCNATMSYSDSTNVVGRVDELEHDLEELNIQFEAMTEFIVSLNNKINGKVNA